MPIGKQIADLLIKQRKTLSVAESCSGGLLGHLLTNTPGSSNYFTGGIIAYSNQTKIKLLNIRPTLFKKYGAVSQPVAKQMALAVQKILKTDFGISITGIAGPSGGTKTKPVGLTYIAIAKQGKVSCKKYYFKGTRLEIKTAAVDSALKQLLPLI